MRYFIKEDDIEKELIDVCLNELHIPAISTQAFRR